MKTIRVDLSKLVVGLLTLFAVSLFLPVGQTLWADVLSLGGSAETGSWSSQPPTDTPTSTATPTSTPSEEPSPCTYTAGYWKNTPEDWPVEEISIGGFTYTIDEAIAILRSGAKGDATYILARYLIPAKLNVLNGTDPSAISGTIRAADDWLIQFPLGTDPKNPDRQDGIDLAFILDQYNTGVIGPGHCEDEELVMSTDFTTPVPLDQEDTEVLPTLTLTPAVTQTATVLTPTTAISPTTATPTDLVPTITPTQRPTGSDPDPTESPDTPEPTPLPTATPGEPEPSATPPPPEATETPPPPEATATPPPPEPTDTPAPPEATDTPLPPPTDTPEPTSPPPPTPTPTRKSEDTPPTPLPTEEP